MSQAVDARVIAIADRLARKMGARFMINTVRIEIRLAYEEGRQAGRSSMSSSRDNPWAIGTDERIAWDAGWRDENIKRVAASLASGTKEEGSKPAHGHILR